MRSRPELCSVLTVRPSMQVSIVSPVWGPDINTVNFIRLQYLPQTNVHGSTLKSHLYPQKPHIQPQSCHTSSRFLPRNRPLLLCDSKTQRSRTHFSQLPNEILAKIAQYLPVNDLLNVGATNSKLHATISSYIYTRLELPTKSKQFRAFLNSICKANGNVIRNLQSVHISSELPAWLLRDDNKCIRRNPLNGLLNFPRFIDFLNLIRPTLARLHIHSCQYLSTEVIDSISQCNNLEELDLLKLHSMTGEGMKYLGMIERLNNLRSLKVSDGFHVIGCNWLRDVLANRRKLEVLEVRGFRQLGMGNQILASIESSANNCDNSMSPPKLKYFAIERSGKLRNPDLLRILELFPHLERLHVISCGNISNETMWKLLGQVKSKSLKLQELCVVKGYVMKEADGGYVREKAFSFEEEQRARDFFGVKVLQECTVSK
ncbi:hypothetical protein BKA69DRAFT_289953 [Paraphysoderma sedebokerense]|nr:hypothetical protein BKA69DRAFT_289953 [Paraphysoderma sedebokerense]